MAFRINQRSVAALRPPDRGTHSKVFYDDATKGFGIRISEAGVKSFVLNYSIRGRERRCTIGRWPEWSADAARKEAGELRTKIDKGIDPLHEKALERGEPLVTDLAEDYLKDYAVPHKRAKSVYHDKRMLKKYILPRLGKLRVSAVGKRDIELLHNSLRMTPYQANRVLALLRKMFAFGGRIGADNPARSGKEGIEPFHEDKRETWLSLEQLHALGKALDEYGDQDAADAIRLLILTGARESEVLKAEWPQFNLKRGVWTKPSHHTKQKKIEHLPLNKGALRLLLRMHEERGGTCLFPGREQRKGVIEGRRDERARATIRRPWTQVCKAASLATEYHIKGKRGKMLSRWRPNVRIHDLRHSFASHLVSGGASLYLVGKLLGHTRSETTERYAHCEDAALRRVTDGFGNVLGTGI